MPKIKQQLGWWSHTLAVASPLRINVANFARTATSSTVPNSNNNLGFQQQQVEIHNDPNFHRESDNDYDPDTQFLIRIPLSTIGNNPEPQININDLLLSTKPENRPKPNLARIPFPPPITSQIPIPLISTTPEAPAQQLQPMRAPISRNETVITIAFLTPAPPLQTGNAKTHKQHKILAQTQVLGSHTLNVFRDAIVGICLADRISGVYGGGGSGAEYAVNVGDAGVIKRGYFFVEGIFYGDVSAIIDWVNENPERRAHFQRFYTENSNTNGTGAGEKSSNSSTSCFESKVLQDVKFSDLSVRINYPYLYVHQGCCQHVVLFREIRLVHPLLDKNLEEFPKVYAAPDSLDRKCQMCTNIVATRMTVDDENAPLNPYFWCEKCFAGFHTSAPIPPYIIVAKISTDHFRSKKIFRLIHAEVPEKMMNGSSNQRRSSISNPAPTTETVIKISNAISNLSPSTPLPASEIPPVENNNAANNNSIASESQVTPLHTPPPEYDGLQLPTGTFLLAAVKMNFDTAPTYFDVIRPSRLEDRTSNLTYTSRMASLNAALATREMQRSIRTMTYHGFVIFSCAVISIVACIMSYVITQQLETVSVAFVAIVFLMNLTPGSAKYTHAAAGAVVVEAYCDDIDF
ncbi:small nuclear RNA activating complex, polypeptide 3 [Physocladia obscura]|uniref:Small nuclear RNA activating complex, polypeptide 3 n=1 Tax=Physocladia obscura TaxID=109957 RepID=A0AAD5XF67_9FUNG|nr:small nuclear RNA activating complex, polypeptide 3 [Physocladia obscura]